LPQGNREGGRSDRALARGKDQQRVQLISASRYQTNVTMALRPLRSLMVIGGFILAVQLYIDRIILSATSLVPISNDPPIPIPSPTTTKGLVAYALSFTQCPATGTSMLEVRDAPAVLAHSVHSQTSAYQYHLIAFVHPLALNCTQHLQSLGYQVQVLPEPVTIEEIQTGKYRRRVQKKGCCGIREFMKLYAYNLIDYEAVVHLDGDVIILKPLDELFDAIHNNDVSGVATLYNTTSIPDRVDFLYTRDYVQMSKLATDPHKYGVQGGFFVVRPNTTIFSEMIGMIREGNFGRRGWGEMQYGGYYGAPQIQGFLSYFYGEFYPNNALEVDPCIYNTLQTLGGCPNGTNSLNTTCPDCSQTKFSNVKLTHFTTCYKPWWCTKSRISQTCRDFHTAWFQLRRSLEQSWNQEVPNDGFSFTRFQGYCTNYKRENYIPMRIPSDGNPTIGGNVSQSVS
jgi:hypothetical protein